MQLALEIAKLETLPLPELRRLWKHYFKTDCDVKKKDYYISRIAYRMQELALGGLKVSTKNLIAEICDSTQKHKALPPYGTRIVREYKGVEHSVKIVMGGFEYNGMKYKSLSSIAKLITGTKISGNYFFGLERYKE